MKKRDVRKGASAPVPPGRTATIRREMADVLRGRTLSARDISSEVGVREREVYEHLEHICKSLRRQQGEFVLTPAECQKCGFVFKDRKRLTRPGKCPECRGTHIREPLYSILESGRPG